jgi:hypothetical protein
MNGWKFVQIEIVCSLGRTRAALSARPCVSSLVPVLKLTTAKCWDPKTWPLYRIQNSSSHKHPIFPMEEDAFVVQPNYMWEYPLVSASEENLLSHFGECKVKCKDFGQSKVWYPYILRSCGVHYRNKFLFVWHSWRSIHSGLTMLTTTMCVPIWVCWMFIILWMSFKM